MNYYCNRCSAPFKPKSNRQRYCSKQCRLANRTADRQQWRKVVAELKREPPEIARHERGVYVYFRELGEQYVGNFVADKGQHVEDKLAGNVTRMSAMSKAEVWMLDAREAKAADRRRHGLPGEFNVVRGLGQPDLYVYWRDPATGVITLVPAEADAELAIAA